MATSGGSSVAARTERSTRATLSGSRQGRLPPAASSAPLTSMPTPASVRSLQPPATIARNPPLLRARPSPSQLSPTWRASRAGTSPRHWSCPRSSGGRCFRVSRAASPDPGNDATTLSISTQPSREPGIIVPGGQVRAVPPRGQLEPHRPGSTWPKYPSTCRARSASSPSCSGKAFSNASSVDRDGTQTGPFLGVPPSTTTPLFPETRIGRERSVRRSESTALPPPWSRSQALQASTVAHTTNTRASHLLGLPVNVCSPLTDAMFRPNCVLSVDRPNLIVLQHLLAQLPVFVNIGPGR